MRGYRWESLGLYLPLNTAATQSSVEEVSRALIGGERGRERGMEEAFQNNNMSVDLEAFKRKWVIVHIHNLTIKIAIEGFKSPPG